MSMKIGGGMPTPYNNNNKRVANQRIVNPETLKSEDKRETAGTRFDGLSLNLNMEDKRETATVKPVKPAN